MCMEDIRIGRMSNSTEALVSVTGNTNKQLVGPNDHRIALVFALVSGSTLFLSTAQMGAQNQGIRQGTSNPSYITFTIETHGNLVCMPWHAFVDVDSVIDVFQVFLNKE